ncbi:MAG: hypothetical protein KDH94_01690 [Coxiellaceae bacterium]|nr:hypothetical protein [Coxiellaceae bacterium]
MNKTRCISREKMVAVGALALFSAVFISATQAHQYAHIHKAAGQHSLTCSTLSNPKGGPCDAFYIFPRSTRTIMINDIQPGKKYQCYFSGYHTWTKDGTHHIVRKDGLVGLSVDHLKSQRGSSIDTKVKSDFTLRNPLQINATDSKHGGSITFELKNHTSGNGNYVTISCTEVNSFSN